MRQFKHFVYCLILYYPTLLFEQAVFWIKNPMDASIILGDTITAIDLAFKQADIKIPLPQQHIYIMNWKDEDENLNRQKD